MNLSPSARVSICLSVCPENCAFPLAPVTGTPVTGTQGQRDSGIAGHYDARTSGQWMGLG